MDALTQPQPLAAGASHMPPWQSPPPSAACWGRGVWSPDSGADLVTSHLVKALELQLQHQRFLWVFRVDFL